MTLQAQLQWLKSAAITLPDAEGISRALALVADGPPYDELFFSELKDDAWLPTLEHHGYFSKSSANTSQLDRRSIVRGRLPLFALARFADMFPSKVAAILLRIPLATVHANADQVLRCLVNLHDQKAITSVHPLAVYLAETTHRATAVWIEGLLQAWIKASAKIEAVGILGAFIAATARTSFEDQARLDQHWQLSEIDRKLVGHLAEEFPLEIARIYFDALSRWAVIRRTPEESSKRGPWNDQLVDDPARDSPSTFWIGDFRDPPTGTRELENTLATRLYATCALAFIGNDSLKITQIESLLRSDRWELFTRVRWQLYAEYPDATRDFARREVLEALPHLGRVDYSHNFEFAQLLQRHAEKNRESFLQPEEVDKFVDVVLAGPLDKQGKPAENSTERERFWFSQLQPIEPLLTSTVRDRIKRDRTILPGDYKPFTATEARTIELVSPLSVEQLAEKSDSELWQFLNSWTPQTRSSRREWWIEETVEALASTLATLLERTPERFNPASKWWERIVRPEMLYRILDRATDRIAGRQPTSAGITELDRETWLGLSEWVVSQSLKSPERVPQDEEEPEPTWTTLSVARILEALIKAKVTLSTDQQSRVVKLLRLIVNARDPRLQRTNAMMNDWLMTAINSARGDAMQAILGIAMQQNENKTPIESWIFEVISARLQHPDESPALFALLGSRLRLLVFLFGDYLKQRPELIFPGDRPQHRDAAVLAHFKYDNPMVGVIQTFPNLIAAGLALVEKITANNEEQRSNAREFGSRLGVHIAFYHWNASFDGDHIGETALDKFFFLASASTRASVIEQIGSAFEKATQQDVSTTLRNRVMQVWERRFAQILGFTHGISGSSTDYQEELSAFADWIRCECFPFDWRVRQVISALNLLTSGPRPYRLVRYIGEQGSNPERLLPLLQLLEALVRQMNDEVRWSLQEKEIRPLLERAFESDVPEVRKQAEATLEVMLKQGLLSFLDVGRVNQGSPQSG